MKQNHAVMRLTAVALLLFVLLLTGCARSPRTVEGERRGEAGNALLIGSYSVQRPVMRVGLTDTAASTLTLSASKGLLLLDGDARPVRRERLRKVSFFIKGYDGSKPSTLFRVQVGSFSSLDSATRLARQLAGKYQQPVVTPFNSQYRTYRVQVGAFASRGAAGDFQSRLRGDGITDSLIITEKTPVEHSGRLNAVNIDGSFIASASRFFLVPAEPGSVLAVNGTRYRGAFELRIGEGGIIMPVNIVHLEEYLKGVVPAEMSSTVYPQLEALKAQALAARTYAVRNRGQYSEQGFDICNTAACQVYKGMPIEQDMTNKAIAATEMEIITYKGEPINALFSSTSGGHTENVENIFQGEASPYLRGVVSRPGREAVRFISAEKTTRPIYGAAGEPLNYYLDVLRHYGYTMPSGMDPLAQPEREFITAVFTRLASSYGGRFSGDGEHALRKIDLVSLFSDALGWRSLVENRVYVMDLEVLFPGGEDNFSTYQKKLALYFLRFGFIKPEADGRLGLTELITNQDIVEILYEILQYQDVFQFHRGNLVNRNDTMIHLEEGRFVHSYRLGKAVRLYQHSGDLFIPMDALKPVSGDMMRALVREGSVSLLIHEPSTQGLTNDRFSRYHHWDVSYSMEELTQRVAEYVNIGNVIDLQPLRYGVSKRIVELKIVGTEGNAVFKGLRIRWVLGLRDTLFTILKVRGDESRQTGWRFIGSGWGHGVGLCQVGSYGMALNGARYDEIIRHFYTGVKIEKAQLQR